MTKEWTEIKLTIDVTEVENAGAIANLCVPYGIYIEDYSHLEEESMEIAHIDLIDEELLAKDRTKAIIHLYISPDENPAEAISFLEERLRCAGISFTLTTTDCAEEDWIHNWKQFFHPMPVGNKLMIHPSWIQDFDPQGRKVLDIEPGLAFGTGTHSTTKLCMEVLEHYVTETSTVLDVGCGSGILSIACLLLGATRATGVDIDEIAVKTAIENGKQNGFTAPKYTVLQGNLTDRVRGTYDLVVANIVADVIILFAKDVGRFLTAGGVFITSGIIAEREEEVRTALEANNFSIIERREDKGWLAFVSKKRACADSSSAAGKKN